MKLRKEIVIGLAAIVLLGGTAMAQVRTPRGGNPEAAKMTNPVAATEASIKRGKEYYDEHCASCHQDQWQDWQSSHHQKAMQIAGDQTVLGDFNDAEITLNENKRRFYKKGDEFWVNTENNDYKIDYTFGFDPLQQYLVRMDDGKYQVLPLSWDSRPVERGGQRGDGIRRRVGPAHLSPEPRLDFLSCGYGGRAHALDGERGGGAGEPRGL